MSELENIRQIDLVSFLADYGYHPIKAGGNKVWYNSPIRGGESAPSFIVLRDKNKWIDFGLDGKTHSIIDFVMAIENCSNGEAIMKLKEKSGIKSFEAIEYSSDPVIVVDKVDDCYTHQYLTDYLKRRNIPEEVYSIYTKQVTYHFRSSEDTKYTSVGFQNDSGGWDLRDPWHKWATSPKTITTIGGESDVLNLFEGFSDMMSACVYFGVRQLQGRTIVLNGLGQLYGLLPTLSRYRLINCYLDKGTKGAEDTWIDNIRSINTNVIDHRYIYREGTKDFNETIC